MKVETLHAIKLDEDPSYFKIVHSEDDIREVKQPPKLLDREQRVVCWG